MKNANLIKQDDSHTTAFALADLRAKFYEERLNVAPLHIAACRASEDQFKGALMLSLHFHMVPYSGTDEHASCRRLTFEIRGVLSTSL